MLMRIRRRKCRKRYLGKKSVYEYERLYVELPVKFSDALEPFLGQDLDVDVKREGDNRLVIVATPRENVSGVRKTPAKTAAKSSLRA